MEACRFGLLSRETLQLLLSVDHRNFSGCDGKRGIISTGSRFIGRPPPPLAGDNEFTFSSWRPTDHVESSRFGFHLYLRYFPSPLFFIFFPWPWRYNPRNPENRFNAIAMRDLLFLSSDELLDRRKFGLRIEEVDKEE